MRSLQLCGRLICKSTTQLTSRNVLSKSSSNGLRLKSKSTVLNHQIAHFHTTKYNSKDYYKILNIEKGANQKEIKKAYYQLAKKYHPDTNKDPESAKKFQEVSEAYECLSDETRRKEYDTFGASSAQGGGGFDAANNPFSGGRTGFQGFHSTIDPEELFKKVFGDLGFDMFKDRSDFSFQENDLGYQASQEIQLKLTFLEAANGCAKKVEINVVDTCHKCKGSKCAEGHQPIRCPFCEGKHNKCYISELQY